MEEFVGCAGKGVMTKLPHSVVTAGTKRHRAKLDSGNTENGHAIARKRPNRAAACSIFKEKTFDLPEEDLLVTIKEHVAQSPNQEAEKEAAAAQGMAVATSEAADDTPTTRVSLCVDPYTLCCSICGERLRTSPIYKCQAEHLMHICSGACFSKLTNGECATCAREGVLYRRSTDLEDIFRLLKLTCPYNDCQGLHLYWEVADHLRECRRRRSHGACSS